LWAYDPNPKGEREYTELAAPIADHSHFVATVTIIAF